MFIVLVLFFSLLSYSQNNSTQDDIFFKGFELGNNGSVFIPYFPIFPSTDLNIRSFDMGLRLIDNYENKEKLDKIYKLPDLVINNEVYYQGSSREGAYVKANLSRPISNNSFLDFNYNNLISKGFYPFQENKYSNLSVEYAYFDKNKNYAFSIFLNTINGFYNEIGGVVDYNLLLSDDLQEVILNDAKTKIKNRYISFNQFYKLQSGALISYNLNYNLFKKNFNDLNPAYFYFDDEIEIFNDSTNYSSVKNKFTYHSNYFSGNNIDYSISYNLYFHALLNKNKGDIILSISNLNNPINEKYNFGINYCFSGPNKNNYNFNFLYYIYSDLLTGEYSLSINRKKTDFFNQNFIDYVDWETDLKSTSNLFLNFKSSFFNNLFDINFHYNRLKNFVFYDNNFFLTQFSNNIDYFKLNLNKKWNFKNFYIFQAIYFQQSFFDSDLYSNILSFPKFLYHQSINYSYNFTKKIKLKTSLDFKIHSNYFVKNYTPSFSFLYNQGDVKFGKIPFFSSQISLNRSNFSLGLLINDIQSSFIDRVYLNSHYNSNPFNFNLFIKWRFLD